MSRINFFRFLIIVFSLISCQSKKCGINKTEVSVLLLETANERNIDYCKILELAKSNDEFAIKQMSLLEFENAVGYDHGTILVELITLIGEEKYISSLKNINTIEKKNVFSYVLAGIEYGSTIKSESFSKRFPKLFLFLKSE